MIVLENMLTIHLLLTIALMLTILVHLDFFCFSLAASTVQKEFQIFQKTEKKVENSCEKSCHQHAEPMIILVTMQKQYFIDWWNHSSRGDQKRMIGVKNVYICLLITSPNFADLTSIVSCGSTRLRGLRTRFNSVVNPLSKFIFGTFSPSQCLAPSSQIKGNPLRRR